VQVAAAAAAGTAQCTSRRKCRSSLASAICKQARRLPKPRASSAITESAADTLSCRPGRWPPGVATRQSANCWLLLGPHPHEAFKYQSHPPVALVIQVECEFFQIPLAAVLEISDVQWEILVVEDVFDDLPAC